jgi:hypothetical protein
VAARELRGADGGAERANVASAALPVGAGVEARVPPRARGVADGGALGWRKAAAGLDGGALAETAFATSDNMTDSLGSLSAALNAPIPESPKFGLFRM